MIVIYKIKEKSCIIFLWESGYKFNWVNDTKVEDGWTNVQSMGGILNLEDINTKWSLRPNYKMLSNFSSIDELYRNYSKEYVTKQTAR